MEPFVLLSQSMYPSSPFYFFITTITTTTLEAVIARCVQCTMVRHVSIGTAAEHLVVLYFTFSPAAVAWALV